MDSSTLKRKSISKLYDGVPAPASPSRYSGLAERLKSVCGTA